jgi:hypothetical protein
MGTNLQKFGEYASDEAQREADDSAAAGGGGDFLKIEVGRNIIRILPPMPGKRSPFRVIYRHFLHPPGAKGPFVFTCPRYEAKKPCPVCAEADRLKASGNPADRDRAFELFASRRVFCNVIDRRKPEEGVKIAVLTKKVHDQLTALRKDPDAGGDFTHPEHGFDIIIERVGKGKTDTAYTVRRVTRESALGELAWLDEQKDLDQYAATLLTPDQIRAGVSGEDAGGGQERRGGEQPRSGTRQRTAQDDAMDGDYEEAKPSGSRKRPVDDEVPF